jgi:type I restriction enzyme S subunit
MAREYKDSGIEWIGQIPKEWEFGKYKYIGTFVKGKLPKDQNNENKGLPIIGASEMLGKEYRTYTLDLNVPICSPIDILILWDGANAGIVANGCDGVVSSTTVKYSCNDSRFNNQYLYYLLKNAEPFFKSKVNGTTIPHMNSKYIDEYICIIPSLFEQEKIADYLDKVCGEADEMIALQEKMIEELKAYKQSIITEVVTKGLNPNVPMKDSGIDWIGQIPEHWEIRRIGNLFKLRDEKNYKPMDEVQLLSLYTGIGVFPHGEQEERGNKAITVEGYKVVHKDDIVVNIILAWMGAIGVSNYDGVTSPAYDVYIPDLSNVVPHFFHYVFRTQGIAGECYKYGRGIMMMRWRTYSSEFKLISVPFPSMEEQQLIANFLDTKCAEIDALIAIKQTKIDELKEYKKSVIYEYVTGKKEVV